MQAEFLHELLKGHPESLRLWCAVYVRCMIRPNAPIDLRELKKYSKLSTAAFYRALDKDKYSAFVTIKPVNKSLVLITFTGVAKADSNVTEPQQVKAGKRTESKKRTGLKKTAQQTDTKDNKPKTTDSTGLKTGYGVAKADSNVTESQNVTACERTEMPCNPKTGGRKITYQNPANKEVNGKNGHDTGLKSIQGVAKADSNVTEPKTITTLVRTESELLIPDNVNQAADLKEDHIRMSTYQTAKERLTLDLKRGMMGVWNQFYKAQAAQKRFVIGNVTDLDKIPNATYGPLDIKGFTLIVKYMTNDLGFETDQEILKTFHFILSQWNSLPDNIRNYTSVMQVRKNLPQIFQILSNRMGLAPVQNPRDKQVIRNQSFKTAYAAASNADYSKFVKSNKVEDSPGTPAEQKNP